MNILTDVKSPPPTIKMLVYIRKGDEPIPEIKVYFNLYEQAQQFFTIFNWKFLHLFFIAHLNNHKNPNQIIPTHNAFQKKKLFC